MDLIGVARVALPVHEGMDMTGFIARHPTSATGSMHPLYCSCLFVRQNRRTWVLFSMDILGLDADFAESCTRSIATALRTSPNNITLCATHTHSGPSTQHLQGCGAPSAAFMHALSSLLVDCAVRAKRNSRPAKLLAYEGKTTIGKNRVSGVKDPSKLSYVDSTLGVLRAVDCDDNILATLVYAHCHPLCFGSENRLFSRDFIEYTEQALGDCGIFFYLNGNAGDISPVLQGGMEAAQQTGRQLAHDIQKAFSHKPKRITGSLAVSTSYIRLPLEKVATYPPCWSNLRDGYTQERVQKPPEQDRFIRAYEDWANRIYQQALRSAIPKNVKTRLQVIQIGDLTLCFHPLELFHDVGKRISQKQHQAWVIGYAPGGQGYLASSIQREISGYEVKASHVYYGLPSAYQPRAEEVLVNAFGRMNHVD